MLFLLQLFFSVRLFVLSCFNCYFMFFFLSHAIKKYMMHVTIHTEREIETLSTFSRTCFLFFYVKLKTQNYKLTHGL